MALKEVVVRIAGLDHTLLLDDEDTKRYTDAGSVVSKAAAPANKARG